MQLTVPVPEELKVSHAEFERILAERKTQKVAALKSGGLIVGLCFCACYSVIYFVNWPDFLSLAPFLIIFYFQGLWQEKRHEFERRLKPIQKIFHAKGYSIVEDAGRGRGALVLKDYPDNPQSP
ncbi:hypothetical protein [Cognatiyoonia sediminum]|uniref:hypothetical protein n=1 Tax=Cognatiyoonia sediminum TaxID=1508389 RepID=UPI001041E59C|nr:hypothetical protein [Cognatiyoonia sediminum]